MQQYATYDTYNPPEEAAEDRAEARSASFGTTCIHTPEFPRCLARSRRRRALQGVLLRRPIPQHHNQHFLWQLFMGVNPPPPAVHPRRSVAGDLDLPAHSKRWCPCRPRRGPSIATAASRRHRWHRGTRLDSRPLRGHSGWDGIYAHASTRMPRARGTHGHSHPLEPHDMVTFPITTFVQC